MDTESQVRGAAREIFLVHGSWFGPWCWAAVSEQLAAVATVHRVSLTGLGDRALDVSPRVGLSTHVDDAVAAVRASGTERAVLVGHSYGGMVTTGAASVLSDLDLTLVYLDAFLPRPGMSCFDIAPGLQQRLDALRIDGAEWLCAKPGLAQLGLRGAYGETIHQRMTSMPVRTHTEPFHYDCSSRDWHRCHFIRCTRGSPAVEDSCRRAKDAGMNMHTIDSGHCPQLSSPNLTSEVLTRIVKYEDDGYSP